MPIYKFIFSFFLFILSFSAQALNINAAEINDQLDMYDHIFVYEDIDKKMTIDDAISHKNKYFTKKNSTHTLGYSHSAYWFKTSIKNSTDADIRLFLANIGSINYLDVYLVEDDKVIYHEQHGSRIEHAQQKNPYRDPLYLLNFKKNSQYDLYLKYNTETSYLITPTLYTTQYFNSERENSAYFFGAYFGILIAIFIYILASAIISKQKVLAYYSIFLAGTIFINHSMLNFSTAVFGLTHTPSFIIAVSCIGSFLMITFFEFCFTLFDLKKYSPWFVKGIRRYFYSFVLLCILLLLFADLVLATQAYFLAMLFSVILGVIFLILIIKHKLAYSIMFSAAWTGYYISLIVLTLAWTGVIDYNPDYLIYMYIATMIETIVFSFILALRYQHVHSVSDSKTELLATAGHDIRQPLQAMMLYKDALSHEVQTAQGQSILASLKLSINALHQLLNKLLDISNIETGMVKVNKDNVNIVQTIEGVVVELMPVALEKGLALTTRLNSQIIFTDKVLLSTIVRNILANALRYVDEGKILITGRNRQQGYLLQIWDTGDGIDAQKLSKIFERYFQMDRFKKNEGIGLGLFICKQFADKLEIDIHVRSKKMKGTVFSLWIKNDAKKV